MSNQSLHRLPAPLDDLDAEPLALACHSAGKGAASWLGSLPMSRDRKEEIQRLRVIVRWLLEHSCPAARVWGLDAFPAPHYLVRGGAAAGTVRQMDRNDLDQKLEDRG